MVEKKSPRFFYGYVIVAAGFFIIMLILGTYFTFGVFFNSLLDEFGWDRATTSAAFSWSFLVMGFLGVIMGKLNDRFGPRLVATVGGFCYGAGFLLIPYISQVWQFYLLYGGLIALGMSCAMVPLMATPPRWFVKKRGLMTSIVVAGSGVGSMLTPQVARWLISSYSWRTAYTVIGTAALVIVVGAAQFLRRDPAKMGLKPQWMTTSTLSDTPIMFKISKGLFKDVIFVSFGELPDSQHPLMKKYKEAKEKYAAKDRWGIFFYAGILFVEPMVEALKICGRDLTADSFVEAMESIKDFQGIGPKISFGPNKRQGSRSSFIGRCAEGGKAVRLSDWITSDIDLQGVLDKLKK